MVSKKTVVKAVIEKIQEEMEDVRIMTAVVEGYDRPDRIMIKGKKDGDGFEPDVMAWNDQGAEIYEVELEDGMELEKWKSFSLYTNRHKGQFYLVTPEDRVTRTREALDNNGIDAKIIYFS